MAKLENFESDKQIEARFETDQPFSTEPPEQSLGRLAWLGVRGSAEFLLTLQKLGVDAKHIPHILDALGEMQTNYYDFALVGLERGRPDGRDGHPLEDAVYDSVTAISEVIRDQHEDYDEPGLDAMSTFVQMSDEALIHELARLQNSTENS